MTHLANRRYNTRFRDVTDELLIGFCILFILGKEGKQVAVLSNNFLKKHFKVDRIYEKRLKQLAVKLNHLFDHKISYDGQGRHILEFSPNGEFDKGRKYFDKIPNVVEIEKSLRIQIYGITVDKE